MIYNHAKEQTKFKYYTNILNFLIKNIKSESNELKIIRNFLLVEYNNKKNSTNDQFNILKISKKLDSKLFNKQINLDKKKLLKRILNLSKNANQNKNILFNTVINCFLHLKNLTGYCYVKNNYYNKLNYLFYKKLDSKGKQILKKNCIFIISEWRNATTNFKLLFKQRNLNSFKLVHFIDKKDYDFLKFCNPNSEDIYFDHLLHLPSRFIKENIIRTKKPIHLFYSIRNPGLTEFSLMFKILKIYSKNIFGLNIFSNEKKFLKEKEFIKDFCNIYSTKRLPVIRKNNFLRTLNFFQFDMDCIKTIQKNKFMQSIDSNNINLTLINLELDSTKNNINMQNNLFDFKNFKNLNLNYRSMRNLYPSKNFFYDFYLKTDVYKYVFDSPESNFFFDKTNLDKFKFNLEKNF